MLSDVSVLLFTGRGRGEDHLVRVPIHPSPPSCSVLHCNLKGRLSCFKEFLFCFLYEHSILLHREKNLIECVCFVGFTRFVYRQVEKYRRFNLCWLQSRKPLLIVRYEKLKTDMKLELRKILMFLSRTISKKTLECVEQRTGEKWHRKKSDFDPFLEMDENVLKRLEDVQSIVDNTIKERETK